MSVFLNLRVFGYNLNWFYILVAWKLLFYAKDTIQTIKNDYG